MKTWMKWGALAPPVAAGALLWAMALALLPAAAAGVCACTLIGVVAYLASGRGEGLAVPALTEARPASRAEATLLAPMRTLLEAHGSVLGMVFVSRGSWNRPAAEPVGRRSIVVSEELLGRLFTNTIDCEAVTVVLAHAEARRQVSGGMRYDIAGRFVALPWLMTKCVLLRLARACGWLPGIALFRYVAVILAATALWQTAAEGLWWVTFVIVLMGALFVGVPVIRSKWVACISRAADDAVAEAGLREPLIRLLATSGGSETIDRIGRLGSAAPKPVRHLHVVPTPMEATPAIHSAAMDPRQSVELWDAVDPNVSGPPILLMRRPEGDKRSEQSELGVDRGWSRS